MKGYEKKAVMIFLQKEVTRGSPHGQHLTWVLSLTEGVVERPAKGLGVEIETRGE